MAALLKLNERDDFNSDITLLDLLAFASGFDLAWPAWTPKVTSGDGKPVKEVIPLIVRGNTRDALAACVHTLDTMIRKMANVSSPVERYQVWLQAQLDGETGKRQVQVLGMTYELSGSPYESKATDGYYYQSLSLIITRLPYWESDAHVSYTLATLNCVGGTADYTTYGGSPGAVTGDEAGRLGLVSFEGEAIGGPLYKFWLGFRSERYGLRANFQPYWSLRKAVAVDTDTTGGTTNADATAKDGYKTITTFATVATLLRRVTIRVVDVSGANYNDQGGMFTVLLRAKLSAAGAVRVRMADGLYPAGGPMTGSVRGRVPISSTSWNFYELGNVQMPSPGRLISGSRLLLNYALGIDAERVSGACSLDMDCLVMIPNDEGFVYADGGAVQLVAADTKPLYVQHFADGTKLSVGMVSNAPQTLGTPSINGGAPIGNGIVVIAGQRQTVSTLADTVGLLVNVYRRWRSIRGVA